MRRPVFGFLVTAVCVALLVPLIDWAATAGALRAANPWLIALAVAFLMVSIAAKAARWRLLLPSASPVTRARLYSILHVSLLLNNVLPARLGDIARVAMTARQPGIRLGHVLSSLLTERFADAATLLAGFLAVSPFLPLPAEYRPWVEAAWWVAALAVGLMLTVTAVRRTVGPAAARRLARLLPLHERLQTEARSFAEGWQHLFARRTAVRVWGWSVVAWTAAFAINYTLMRALDIDAPLSVAVVLTCTTNLAMLLPSSPGYIGVFHAAATLSLLPFGVGAHLAFSFAILAHLVNVLPVSLVGAAFLLWGRDSGAAHEPLRAADEAAAA